MAKIMKMIANSILKIDQQKVANSSIILSRLLFDFKQTAPIVFFGDSRRKPRFWMALPNRNSLSIPLV